MASTKAVNIEDLDSITSNFNSENPDLIEHTSLRKTLLQGGYECLFVREPPPELPTSCSICLCLLKEPRLIDCECGSNFCRTCIEPVKEKGKPCPLCNVTFSTSLPNRQLERVLNEMQVYCSHKESGCEWKGELANLPQHLNIEPSDEERLSGCQYAFLKCLHCKESILRLEILDHETSKCLQRPFSCDYCHNFESTCQDVTDNHWPICPLRPLPCPNKCGLYPERQNLEKHQENDCPATVVECPFSYAGCKIQLPRKDMPFHISENVYTHMSSQATYQHEQIVKFQDMLLSQKQHYEQQLKDFQEAMTLQANDHQRQMEELRESLFKQTAASEQQVKNVQEMLFEQKAQCGKKMEKLQRNLEKLETEKESLRCRINLDKQTLQDQVRKLSSRLEQQSKELERENFFLKQKLEQQAKSVAELLRDAKGHAKKLQEMKKEQTIEIETRKSIRTEIRQQSEIVGKLKTEVESTKRSQESSAQRMNEKTHEIEKALKAASLRSTPKAKDTAVHPNSVQIEQIRGDISELRSEVKDTLRSHIGLIPLEVIMHNFRQHKNNGIDWFSSPFFTHPRGYKMCLNVDANGYGEGKGTHVSVFIYMMQGEFDNELKWPFKGTITVQALNRERTDREANPHYTVIRFDPVARSTVASRVFQQNSRADSGQGMLKFIAHNELQRKFLVEDCLCFRLSRVDFL